MNRLSKRIRNRNNNNRPSNHGKRSKARDWKKYNAFRKDEYRLIPPIVVEVVNKAEQAYKVKEKCIVAKPPADPRSIAICLLIRAIFGLSYRSVYSLLSSSTEYRRMCGLENLPGYNTVQEHAKDVPEKYLDHLIRLTSEQIMRVQGRRKCDSTCDSTGLLTNSYGRWFDVRISRKSSKKKRFVKLHAHITTDTDMPFFLSAKVTKGYKADSKRLSYLLKQKSKTIEIGEMSLDSAYLSRKNAQLIAKEGAKPYIALKENTASALSLGYPTWNNMVH